VEATPLDLARAPLIRRLFPTSLSTDVNNKKEALYVETLRQLQEERSALGHQSTMDVDLSQCSETSHFLLLLLRYGIPLKTLEIWAPNTLKEALQRTPETLTRATGVWKDMTDRFFRNLGRPVPDWPGFVEIQEELGIYGKTAIHRAARRITRRAQMVGKRVIHELRLKFPESKALKRKQCYLSAALTEDYVMPEGWISCKKGLRMSPFWSEDIE
jgi:hypothetical protein